MLQSDYNSNPYQCILYYCNNINGDTTIYDIFLSNVCSLGYDGSGNIQISGWLIVAYGAPSTATILTYSISTVLTWYNNFYTIPLAIQAGQTYSITYSQLSAIRSDNTLLGCIVLDTTNGVLRTWGGGGLGWFTGSDKYLLKNGTNSMTGNLNMGTNSINNAVTVYQSTPSCISIWSSDVVGVSFTANTPKVIAITGFSQSINPNSDFTFTSTTGQIQYTGSTSRYFRVTIQYSYAALALAATMTQYISKNGSTTINGARTVVTFILLGQLSVFNSMVTDIVQLNTNDTIQLGGELSSSNSVNIQAVAYSIQQI